MVGGAKVGIMAAYVVRIADRDQSMTAPPPSRIRHQRRDHTARIESLKVSNFRALQDFELQRLTPLTALLGPNGSGKSTVFDVFNFLTECFQSGLRGAWDRRGRAREIKTRDQDGPVVLEIQYRENSSLPKITYHLALDEVGGKVVVEDEWLAWKRNPRVGRPFRFLEYRRGHGKVVSGEMPDSEDHRIDLPFTAPDLLAASTVGQMAEHPRVAALRDFITDWHVSCLSVDETRGVPEAGPQDRLSKNGDNLANVIQYLKESRPDQLGDILSRLRERVPRIESVEAEPLGDGRLLLQIKDGPFKTPVLSRYASDGTLKLLACLVLLHNPTPPRFIGIEEPENYLHPRLLPVLAEECRMAAERSQALVTTHSPFFISALRPDEVRVLYRNEHGHTQSVTAVEIPGVAEHMRCGGQLGHLWMEGLLGVGDPLVNGGAPKIRRGGGR